MIYEGSNIPEYVDKGFLIKNRDLIYIAKSI